MDFTDEEYSEWRELRVTKQILSKIREEKFELAEHMAEGGTLADDGTLTVQNTALQVGKVQGLSYILQERYLDD